MKTNNTADAILYNWTKNKTNNQLFVDLGVWPSNIPCSALPP